LEKWFFWTPKDCCPPFAGAKKTFLSTLNVMISQMLRNESVRFGRHIDKEVSYKILQLEVPRMSQFYKTHLAFSRGCFEANFVKNTLGCLGVNPYRIIGYHRALRELGKASMISLFNGFFEIFMTMQKCSGSTGIYFSTHWCVVLEVMLLGIFRTIWTT
jgi:hypothetical protein